MNAALWRRLCEFLDDVQQQIESLNELVRGDPQLRCGGGHGRVLRPSHARLTDSDREIVARLLEESYVGGIHDTLVAVYDAQLPPSDDGYEGSPFHDFMGRVQGWDRPT